MTPSQFLFIIIYIWVYGFTFGHLWNDKHKCIFCFTFAFCMGTVWPLYWILVYIAGYTGTKVYNIKSQDDNAPDR